MKTLAIIFLFIISGFQGAALNQQYKQIKALEDTAHQITCVRDKMVSGIKNSTWFCIGSGEQRVKRKTNEKL